MFWTYQKWPCDVDLNKHKKLNNTQIFSSSQYLLWIVVSLAQFLLPLLQEEKNKKKINSTHTHAPWIAHAEIFKTEINILCMQLKMWNHFGFCTSISLNTQNHKKILWICWFYFICASFSMVSFVLRFTYYLRLSVSSFG